MAKTFDLTFINGYAGDPAVLVHIQKTGENLLLDCGLLGSAKSRDLLKVQHLFVSHTHVDHFIGFDRLIRLNIPHGRKLHVYGPEHIIQQVQNKLLGYTWNLIQDHQLPFEITEVLTDGSYNIGQLGKYNDFEAEVCSGEKPRFSTELNGGVTAEGIALDHKGTDSIAYLIKYPQVARVNGSRLSSLGYETGPWIQQLLDAVASHRLEGVLQLAGQPRSIKSLKDELIYFDEAESLLYVTDASFDRENLARLKSLGEANTVVCETSFAYCDLDRALDKAHLTTKHGAMIASLMGAEEFIPFHVSNIYASRCDEVIREAQNFFEEFKSLPRNRLRKIIDDELQSIQSLESGDSVP